MDCTVVIDPVKELQRNLSLLSKRMPGFMVQRMAKSLCQARTITPHEEQVVTSKATDMGKASTLLQMIYKKGRNACSSFFECLRSCDPKLYGTVTGYPVQVSEEDHYPEGISETQPSYSQTCVINIHNSVLKNCVIGNDNKHCVTCGQHALLSQNDVMDEDEMEAIQSHDQRVPAQDPESAKSIYMEYSHLEYVTIGNNNNMTITEYVDSEENSEEDTDTEVEPDENCG